MFYEYAKCSVWSPLICAMCSEMAPDCGCSGLFPVVRSNLHPVHSHEFQSMLLRKFDGLERSPLSEFLAADILGFEVQAMVHWLPEQHEEVSVRFRPVACVSSRSAASK